MVEHTTTVQVRWGDADPAGIAFYPRFFEWYDIGTEALFDSLGLTWAEAFPRYGIVGVPILEAGSRFVSPVRYGDAVTCPHPRRLGPGEDVPGRARDRRRRPALCGGIRGPRLGGAPGGARRAAPRTAHSPRRRREARGLAR